MAGRGPQSFKKRQREQARKEKQDEKRTKRLQPKWRPRNTRTRSCPRGNPESLEELQGISEYDGEAGARTAKERLKDRGF